MNIGVNARLLSDGPLEGMGRYTLETVCVMAKAHPESTFYLFFDKKIYPQYLLLPNVKGVLVWCPTRHPLLILFWFEVLLPYFLKKHKIDVFYSADNFTSIRTRVPCLLICHDLAYRHFPEGLSKTYLQFYTCFMPKYLHKAKRIGTVSEFVINDIALSLGIRDKLFLAPNALPSIIVNNSASKPEQKITKPYFIYVGSIHPRKNIKRTIESFMLFNQQVNHSCHLVLLGRNAWGNTELNDLLKEKYIIHLENADDDQKYELIKNSEGLLYISLHEGFGIPVLEGFACGVPVITSNTSSMPEVAGDAAIIVDPTSVSEISKAMEKLFKNKEKTTDLVQKGKKRLEDFQWEHTGNIIYHKFTEIIIR